jgi:ProP effector
VPTPKPAPPPPEDPAVIAARRAQRTALLHAALKEIMTRWPHTFPPYPEPVRPLALGIVQVVATQIPQMPKTLLRHAIAFWQQQRRTPYLQALIAGGPRYDLEGNPLGEVTPEQQERAREELITWRDNVLKKQVRKEQRRAAYQRDHPATATEGSTTGDSQDPPTASEV